MKALVLEEVGKLNIKDIDKPVAKDDEVIVKVMAAGVCGSDIPRAYRDGAHNMPLVIGHEFAGVVEMEKYSEEYSDETEEMCATDKCSAKPGTRVGIFPLIPCKKCAPCLNKQYEMCRNYNYLGSRCNGGFAQYVSVPKWNLIELPDNVTYEQAAMLEPMAVAVHAMRRVDITRTDNVVVCGLGTIGTLLVMFLLDAGISNIFVIGNKDFQKKTITGLGIAEENYCDSRNTAVSDYIKEKTGGQGANVFFECVGSNETISLAVDNTAPAGSICLVGNPHSDIAFDKNVYWKILRNQIRLTGTWNSSFYGESQEPGNAIDDWHYVIDRLASGSISPQKLIKHKYSLDTMQEGMEIMRDKTEDYVKIMVYPNE